MRRARLTLLGLLAVLAAAAGPRMATEAARGAGGVPTVYAFPIPGSRTALPQTQISFRGQIPDPSELQVTGSSSGVHGGTVKAHSDGHGASFIPSSPFAAGEKVTVRTAMNVAGADNGVYQFTVADPAGRITASPRVTAARVRGDIERFRSRPDLAPAAIRITRNSSRTAPGDLFLAPQSSPVQDGPQIRDWRGRLLWYKAMPRNQYVSDFRAQKLNGKPVLTWWQGYVNNGIGTGADVIADEKYRTIDVVFGANGAAPDLHEFRISRRGTALLTSYYPIWWDERPAGGPARAVILDSVVQEIDLATGLVMFQWNALDHVSVAESYKNRWKNVKRPWDFFHVNSIQELGDGNLLLSGRNTWAAYKVDRHTGAVIWRLGGKRSSFRMGRGTGFAFQHDVELHRGGLVSVFDDGAGPPVIHSSSRVLGLRLDFAHKTASEAFSWGHSPSILAFFEGNAQQLGNGDFFTGWGSDPSFSEYSSRGAPLFDAHFVASAFHNRAYRLRWNATPATLPRAAAVRRGGATIVYASWNGATGVGRWRVLAGPSPSSLRTVGSAAWSGFETAISVRAAPWVAVVALDGRGRPISGQSAPVRG